MLGAAPRHAEAELGSAARGLEHPLEAHRRAHARCSELDPEPAAEHEGHRAVCFRGLILEVRDVSESPVAKPGREERQDPDAPTREDDRRRDATGDGEGLLALPRREA